MPEHKGLSVLVLYKFCSVDAAKYIQAGNLKLGTFSSYARLESSRADRNEGSLFRVFNNVRLENDSPDPTVRDFIAHQSFFGLADGTHLTVGDVVIQEHTPDLNCFCMTWHPGAEPVGDGPQALFRIADPAKLFDIVLRRLVPAVDACWVGRVLYAPRSVAFAHGFGRRPDPFLKPPEYQWEKEVRAVFRPSGPRRPETLFTGENHDIRRLFERVR